MMTTEQLQYKLTQYANLILQRGVILEQGQQLVITCSEDNLYFAKLLAKCGYELGAGDVQLRLEDEELEFWRSQYGEEAMLFDHMQAKAKQQLLYNERGACYVRCLSPNLTYDHELTSHRVELLKGLKDKLQKPSLSSQFAFVNRRHASPVATVAWAQSIYPHLNEEDAYKTLWEQLLYIAYCDGEDCVADWDSHINELITVKEKLNALPIQQLHFQNEHGTNLKVQLAEDYVWYGGYAIDGEGKHFYPSIPTEEIFTAPHREGVNGIVYSSMPLVHEGKIISKFWLQFEQGAVVNWGAEVGADDLEAILASDEGALRLGEVALVSSQSRIARSDILYYETLCDENRTCHLALGMGYPGCIRGNHTFSELQAKGLNHSSVHVDFMFGTEDMTVTATFYDGSTRAIMEHGAFRII